MDTDRIEANPGSEVRLGQSSFKRGIKKYIRKRHTLPAALAALIGKAMAPRADAAALPYVSTGLSQTCIVLYNDNAVPSDAAAKLAQAGGTLVASYAQIGVVIATSDNAAFVANRAKDCRVKGAAATTAFGGRVETAGANDTSSSPAIGTPVPGNDSLSSLQRDMDQIHAPEARVMNGGDASVFVGDIDTGLDYTHPDFAKTSISRTAFRASAECRTPIRRHGWMTMATEHVQQA